MSLANKTGGKKAILKINRKAELTILEKALPKSLYFLVFAAIGAVIPYMSIFYKQYGMDAKQIGILTGGRTFTFAVVCPLWGCLADYYRCRKSVLLISLLGWISLASLPILTTFFGFCSVTDAMPGLVATSNQSDALTHEHNQSIVFLNSNHSREALLDDNHRSFINHTENSYSSNSDRNISEHLSKKENHQLLDNGEKFAILMGIIFVTTLFSSPCIPLVDTSALETIGHSEDSRQYGRYRMLGPCGFGISYCVVGLLLSRTDDALRATHPAQFTDATFRPAFITASTLFAVAFMFALPLKLGYNDTDENRNETFLAAEEYSIKRLWKTLLRLDSGCYVLSTSLVAVAMGIMWSFLNWHLHNLGVSYKVIGISGFTSSIGELLMFFSSTKFIDIFGHATLLTFGMVCFVVRLLVYYFIQHPWIALPTEFLNGLTFASVWSALICCVSEGMPRRTLGSIMGILFGLIWGIGAGLGGIIGGVLVFHCGAVNTFLVCAIMITCVIVCFNCIRCVSRSFGKRNPHQLQDDDEEVDLTDEENLIAVEDEENSD